jgi:hypothetical protein
METGYEGKADPDGDGEREGYALLPVHKMELFHCPERTAQGSKRFLGYVQNTMNPDGPLDSGLWDAPVTIKPSSYRRPAEVAFMIDAEREDIVVEGEHNVNTNDAGPSVRAARKNFYEAIETNSLQPIKQGGGIDIMDLRTGSHLPQGKVGSSGKVNTWDPDEVALRRGARQLHLNRFTNGMFMDGHGAGIQAVKHGTDVENYAYWLRIMGVRDYMAAAAAPIK